MTFFSLILTTIHWLFALRCLIAQFCVQVAVFVRSAFLCHASSGALYKRLTGLHKLPVHISLVIVEDDISFSDIARLVAWSMVAGIAYVTIYDHRGRCKANCSLILDKISKEHNKVRSQPSRTTDTTQNGCKFDLLTGSLLTGDSNKHSASDGQRVFIVGPDDGRQGLVSVARQLSVAVATRQLELNDISVSYVDSVIQAQCFFPDPDLVLKFGRVESLVGFLPWHLRLSEIICLPSHRNVHVQQFIDAIVYYGGTEQRFGK